MGRKHCKVLLKNRTAYLKVSSSQLRKLDKVFRYHPKGFEYAPAYKYYVYRKRLQRKGELASDEEVGGWDGYQRLINRRNNSLPAGLVRAMAAEVEKKVRIKFKIQKELAPVYFNRKGLKSEEKKWLFQNDCVKEMILNAEQGGGLILNATGTGKTRIAGMFFSWLSGSAVFIVDELTLLKQSRKALEETLGEKVGIVGESKFRPRRITVATVQTMHKYRLHPEFRKWTKTLDVVMIDEVHIQINRRNFQTIAAINPPCVFGLTATLAITKKSTRLRAYSLCGPVLYKYPLTQGQKDNVLEHGVVVQVSHAHFQPKNSKGKWIGKYLQDYQRLIVDCVKRNEIIEEIIKYALKKKKFVVLLVERVQHVREMHDRFRKIPHRLAYGAISANDRFIAAKDMNKGKVNLIIANNVFKKGIDISRLDVIIDAAAKKSWEDTVQKFGRGVRKHIDKNGLIHFDIRDEANRFEEASEKRRKSFKRLKVPIIQITNNHRTEPRWVKRAFRKAEHNLREIKQNS
jgi:superfamily II DNA or RNA helicase